MNDFRPKRSHNQLQVNSRAFKLAFQKFDTNCALYNKKPNKFAIR